MSLAYIREYYGVPAEKGRRIRYKDEKEGVITRARGGYIGVVFDGDKPTNVHPLHATDQVEYLGIGEVPKLTQSQRRYQQYLEADTSLTFAEWLGIKKDR